MRGLLGNGRTIGKPLWSIAVRVAARAEHAIRVRSTHAFQFGTPDLVKR